MVLVAYNAHYSSKYLQTFTLHHISTNCSSINKGTIPEVLANIVFIFSTAPSFLVRSRSSTVSRLAQTPLLSQFSKGAFALESLPCNLLICQTHEVLMRTSMCGAKGGVLSHADRQQGPHTSPSAMGMYCRLFAAQSIPQGGNRRALHFIQDFSLVPDSSVWAIKHQLRPVLQTQLPATSMH